MRRFVAVLGLLTNSGKGAVHSFVFTRVCSSSACSYCSGLYQPSLSPSNTIVLRRLQVRGGNVNEKNAALDRSISTSLMAELTDDNVHAQSKSNIAKYHLIWSPHFWKKLIISLLICSSIGSIGRKFNVQYGMHSFFNNRASCHAASREISTFGIILPLLSSSCCAIQLLINAVSGLGCAGFNSYLGKPSTITWKAMANPTK